MTAVMSAAHLAVLGVVRIEFQPEHSIYISVISVINGIKITFQKFLKHYYLQRNVSVFGYFIRRRITQRIPTIQPLQLLFVNEKIRTVQGPVVNGDAVIFHGLRVEAGPVSDYVTRFVVSVQSVHGLTSGQFGGKRRVIDFGHCPRRGLFVVVIGGGHYHAARIFY